MSRLLWGMGVFNSHVLGTVSLACSDYDLPPSHRGDRRRPAGRDVEPRAARWRAWRFGATPARTASRSTKSPTRRPTLCCAPRRTGIPARRAISSTSGRRRSARRRWSLSPTRPAPAKKARIAPTSGTATIRCRAWRSGKMCSSRSTTCPKMTGWASRMRSSRRSRLTNKTWPTAGRLRARATATSR